MIEPELVTCTSFTMRRVLDRSRCHHLSWWPRSPIRLLWEPQQRVGIFLLSLNIYTVDVFLSSAAVHDRRGGGLARTAPELRAGWELDKL